MNRSTEAAMNRSTEAAMNRSTGPAMSTSKVLVIHQDMNDMERVCTHKDRKRILSLKTKVEV